MVNFADMKLFKAEEQRENLRYQINPHFFMNTLNNIHALVDIDPEKAKESFVKIAVVIDAGRIIFRCINSKSSAAPGDGKGLGQENTRRRFELLYGEAYTLHIDDMPDRYEVFLVLPVRPV